MVSLPAKGESGEGTTSVGPVCSYRGILSQVLLLSVGGRLAAENQLGF